MTHVKKGRMPTFHVATPQRSYDAVVERGIVAQLARYIPAKAGKVFVISEENVWRLCGAAVEKALQGINHQALFLPGGEENKRLAPLERLAEQMVEQGADRTSVVIAFGGGIVNDMAGFLAAIFMRGIPVLQIPTTLLAQVDAAIGGKTGVNLTSGKNLIGSFHQPRAVLNRSRAHRHAFRSRISRRTLRDRQSRHHPRPRPVLFPRAIQARKCWRARLAQSIASSQIPSA